jgi:pseudouridine-5'-phosphate glycosidase
MKDIMKMNREELNEVTRMIKARRAQLATIATTQFKVGDKVVFATEHNKKIEGLIEKINRKNIIVNAQQNGRWNVAATLLNAA